ncbi:hypothetical protein V5N11_031864 [Cardamine amara subsp. amara]|uniref:GRF-type domain-containing protein n=1 Tax=Cardamine amara subsp. amara TaxID=228776 RepID=A0ABD1A6B7_CARAN
MASSASSRVSESLRSSETGIPRKCRCGKKAMMRTADTLKNPGRLFYCCPYGSREDNTHLFKWTDRSMVEEMANVENCVVQIEGNVGNLGMRLSDVEDQMDTLALETRTCEAVANSFAKMIEANKEGVKNLEKEMGDLKLKLSSYEKEVRSIKNMIVCALVMFMVYWFMFA